MELNEQSRLFRKYIIEKADGSPVDPNADYFVLRLDTDQAAQAAALAYAKVIEEVAPKFAFDIRLRVQQYRPRHLPNNTTCGDDLLLLIAEFMNLVDACKQKGVTFDEVDGCDLDRYRDAINWYLALLGYDDAEIADIWTGELQLTGS